MSDFRLAYAPLPTVATGDVLVRAIYLSLDPLVRATMSAAGTAPCELGIGDVMTGDAVAVVVESCDPRFEVGDAVEGMLGWQEYAVRPGSELRKLDPALVPISTALGVLGTPGLTAFFGLLDLCDPQPGETVVVSEAAGAVGMLVGQIASIRGCRVVGVVAGPAKISWLVDDLGFDAALSYTTETDLDARLAELCPNGIDVYFDNAGGAITDGVVRRLNSSARMAICGQSSLCNLERPESGPHRSGQWVARHAKARGFLVAEFLPRFHEAYEQLACWLGEGKIKFREEVAQGLEAAPQAFIAMLQGRSEGLQLVRL